MAIYQLPTGTYETRAAFAVRGGSLRDKRHFAATAVLAQHPEGDLLIDAAAAASASRTIPMPELGEGATGVIEPRQEISGIGRIVVHHAGIAPTEGYLASVAARLARPLRG